MASLPDSLSIIDRPRRPLRALRRHPGSRRRGFGLRAPFTAPAATVRSNAISDDLRLFGATFVAGFLFVSVLLA
jgi:hypothetical protein